MKVVVGNDSPKDVHTLIHGTCDCVVLHGKWNFADVTNGMDLQMKRTSWYTQVGPVSSYEFLKLKVFPGCGQREMRQRNMEETFNM